MPHKCLLILLLLCYCCLGVSAAGKVPEGSPSHVRKYNVDSLLLTFRVNPLLRDLLDQGSALFDEVGLKEADVSRQAFELAYLTRKLIEQGKLRADGYLKFSLIKKNILVVADYTKPARVKRLAVVDLSTRKLFHNTMVAHGSGEPVRHVGRKKIKNFRFSDSAAIVPVNFSDRDSSNLSTLGFMVTLGMQIPKNDCHLCRFNRDSLGHVCQMGLAGMELGQNERVEGRAIIMHTTGSKNWADRALADRPRVNDPLYHISRNGNISLCHQDYQDKGSPDYAAKEYIDAVGYIGRSEGCLVLPEEEHIAVIRDVMSGSLVFSYSNVISPTSDYFENSPVMLQLREMVNGVVSPVFAVISSGTPFKWNPDWNRFVYEEVMRHRELFIHNELLPKADILALWPGFFQASDEQRGAFWVAVVASLARFNSGFDPGGHSPLASPMNTGQGLLQLSYIDSETYKNWDFPLRKKSKNILDPKVNLQSGVVVLGVQLLIKEVLFDSPKPYWPVLNNKREEFIAFFKGNWGAMGRF